MSLGEIEALVRRAALGRGLPYGLAEEAGQAAAWLAAAGLDAGEAVAAAVDGVRDGCAGRTDRCPCCRGGDEAPKAVLCLGPSMLDRLALPDHDLPVVRLDVPLVLLGMAGARGDQLAATVRVRFEVGPARSAEAWISRDTLIIDGPYAAAPLADLRAIRTRVTRCPAPPTTTTEQSTTFTARLEAHRRRALDDGVELRPEIILRLQAHARRSLVPSSAASRERGAGAGLVDRD